MLVAKQTSPQVNEIPDVKAVDVVAPSWKLVAARRQAEINNAIPTEYLVPLVQLGGLENRIGLPEASGILTHRELEITARSATGLLRFLHNGTYTAVEVTTAFCKRAAIAHQAVNCLALVMFQQALADAAELDQYMQTHHRPKGPLHGLPISVKEHIELAGTPATAGLISLADSVSSQDAMIVRVLREAGAVFHVKTTNPQTLLALETESNIYGITVNPYNINLSSGGSSGGEAALIAMRGSLLGIGTDMGGSIRAPSAFNGVFGLKPSVGRLPHGGLEGLHSGMENVIGCCGPIATCVEDMRLFCQVILASEPWRQEPEMIEKPWNPIPLPTNLKIGVMWHDGVAQPQPPVTRCLRETVLAIQQAGHTVVYWDPKDHPALTKSMDRAFFIDAGKEYWDVIKQGEEPAVPVMQWILTERNNSPPLTVVETWKLNSERKLLQNSHAAQWDELDLDAIICPVHFSNAPAIHEAQYAGYTNAFNRLDYTAAVFPVGKVEPTDTWENFPRAIEQSLGKDDDFSFKTYTGPDKYRHSPVSLQIVTRRLQEEKNLAIIEKVIQAVELKKQLLDHGLLLHSNDI
ncbi:hypothetical protein V499_01918 [Pseudogymnoascus sp. VKM F-103]|nr:hypothetical protein V499_01918 [Pseudogymnoascus sp. VKM F-103]